MCTVRLTFNPGDYTMAKGKPAPASTKKAVQDMLKEIGKPVDTEVVIGGKPVK